jgi:hypothetical protein
MRILLLIITCLISGITISQQDSIDYGHKLMKSEDLEDYLNALKTDKALQLERLTAFIFHHKINEYRIRNNKGWLFWNDDMWLASRNHNIYLFHYRIITHGQNPDSVFFSGRSPGDRLIYVNNSNIMHWGENCCYFPIFTQANTELIVRAEMAADEAFNLWQNSSGHNKNMLGGYNMHGTAFLHSCYGTSVFGKLDINEIEINEISICWDEELGKSISTKFIIRDKQIHSSTPNEVFLKAAGKVLASMLPSDKNKNCPYMTIAAAEHLKYMKRYNTGSLTQNPTNYFFYEKTTKRRYIKADPNIKWYNLIFKRIYEKNIYLEFPISEFFDINKVISRIEIATSQDIPSHEKIDKYGYDIDFYYDKNRYFFVLDMVYTLK